MPLSVNIIGPMLWSLVYWYWSHQQYTCYILSSICTGIRIHYQPRSWWKRSRQNGINFGFMVTFSNPNIQTNFSGRQKCFLDHSTIFRVMAPLQRSRSVYKYAWVGRRLDPFFCLSAAECFPVQARRDDALAGAWCHSTWNQPSLSVIAGLKT